MIGDVRAALAEQRHEAELAEVHGAREVEMRLRRRVVLADRERTGLAVRDLGGADLPGHVDHEVVAERDAAERDGLALVNITDVTSNAAPSCAAASVMRVERERGGRVVRRHVDDRHDLDGTVVAAGEAQEQRARASPRASARDIGVVLQFGLPDEPASAAVTGTRIIAAAAAPPATHAHFDLYQWCSGGGASRSPTASASGREVSAA